MLELLNGIIHANISKIKYIVIFDILSHKPMPFVEHVCQTQESNDNNSRQETQHLLGQNQITSQTQEETHQVTSHPRKNRFHVNQIQNQTCHPCLNQRYQQLVNRSEYFIVEFIHFCKRILRTIVLVKPIFATWHTDYETNVTILSSNFDNAEFVIF